MKQIVLFLFSFLILTLPCVLNIKAQPAKDPYPIRAKLYPTLNEYSWDQLTEAKPFKYTPPYTINLQIQPVHSPSWTYVHPFMGVTRRYVSEDLVNNVEKTEAAHKQDDMLLQFAFDDPAFMPDFRQVNMHLKENKYLVPSTDYYANDIYYHIDYAMMPLNTTQNVLCVTVSVKNEAFTDKVANVRAKLGYYPENEIFDYHYIPFSWDNTKWRAYDKISMENGVIYKKGKKIGQIISENMDVEWEQKKTYTDKNYEDMLFPQVWFGSGYVLPPYRLKNIQDVIHAHKLIKPNEVVSFYIKLLIDDVNATDEEYNRLASLTSSQIEEKAIEGYKKELDGEVTQMNFDKNNWSDIFSTMQLGIKQMLIKYPDKNFYQTAQGGTSERFNCWNFEAVHMLRSMLRTGQFEDVRKGLDFLFSLQDANCPPIGKFTTTAGSIGTTGNRWANSTGMALVLACDYYLYTHDESFVKEYLPKILKAVHWIEGEVKATRKLNTDGSRPRTYGLMPWAVGCDADEGFCVSDTDIFTFWGFNKAVTFLEDIKNAEAPILRKELDLYHQDLLTAINLLKRPNGYINRIIVEDGVKQNIQPKFEISDAMTPIVLVGIMDPENETFINYMRFFENNFSDGEFMGALDREIMYTNQCEHNWQQAYLKLGEWKKAFMLLQTCLQYGMSPDCHQTAERFSKRNPAFAPWQPNGSANGRIIDMILNSFYFENSQNMITLLGAIPFEWLLEVEHTSIKNLFTLTGKINMAVDKIKDSTITLKLTSDNSLPETVRIPEHYHATTHAAKKISNDTFKLNGNLKEIIFTLKKYD